MTKINSTLLFFTLILSHALWSQGDIDKELADAFNNIYKQKTDAKKLEASDVFVERFKEVLSDEASFTNPFGSLQMAKLTAPDEKFRLYNWNVNLDNGKERYYAIIQVPKRNKVVLIELQDKSDEITGPEQAVLNQKKWYGALYYEIVKEKKSSQYMLLGWDGYSKTSNKKIIETMSLNGQNVRFGAPILRKGKLSKKRVIFEYAEDAVMHLRYEPKSKRIIFDHLAPIGNHIEKENAFFAPDLTFDAYAFKKGKWNFQDNIEFLRPKTGKDKDFNYPEGFEKK